MSIVFIRLVFDVYCILVLVENNLPHEITLLT